MRLFSAADSRAIYCRRRKSTPRSPKDWRVIFANVLPVSCVKLSSGAEAITSGLTVSLVGDQSHFRITSITRCTTEQSSFSHSFTNTAIQPFSKTELRIDHRPFLNAKFPGRKHGIRVAFPSASHKCAISVAISRLVWFGISLADSRQKQLN